MSISKIQPTHCDRLAYVYVRQSTPGQVLANRESTERQYQLQARAMALGWSPTRVEIIDEDQGRSGSTAAHRTGFQRLVSEVGLGRVGIVLMLEASRLARNNSDWYRLIEICGVSATLIADEGAVSKLMSSCRASPGKTVPLIPVPLTKVKSEDGEREKPVSCKGWLPLFTTI
jgi:hypothetical protein